uniref:NADH-ubiquinone oxidoreductase chain 4L n=1 Tax=Thitarodes damxungensis TaxID=92018 RepID=A0A5C0F333_9NEOP|nr:NADH dehydrogenase subunit 4L [Thitarodes damxungensis]QEI59719.1 NADH dehydrogenase subunit 4L [Thitarodes damxungensis]
MEMFLMMFISFYMFMLGNMIYSSKRKHLLVVLLSLEFMVLSLFFFLMIYLINIDYEFYFLMIFLVFSVCEGALGLSILISMIPTNGNDYFQSFNLLM